MRCAAAVLLTVALWPCVCIAQADRVLLVAPDGPAARRVAAELAASGFNVTTEPTTPDVDEPAVETMLAETHAVAAIRIAPNGRGVEVWVVAAMGRPPTRSEVRGDADPSEPATELLAVRAVELLRAALIEVRPRPGEPSTPTRRNALPLTPTARAWTIAVGGSLGGTPAGLGPAGGLRLAAEWRAHRWFAVAVAVDCPLYPVVLEGPEGRSEQWLGLAHVALRLPWLAQTEPLSAWVGVALGAAILLARGQATAGWTSLQGDAVSGLAHVELGVRWAPTEWFRVELETRAAGVFPDVVVQFAGRPVSAFGRVYLSATLSVGVAL